VTITDIFRFTTVRALAERIRGDETDNAVDKGVDRAKARLAARRRGRRRGLIAMADENSIAIVGMAGHFPGCPQRR
jgi:hypothetical protein